MQLTSWQVAWYVHLQVEQTGLRMSEKIFLIKNYHQLKSKSFSVTSPELQQL